MIILNDTDKSAYGTLKGLVALLQQEVQEVRENRKKYSERSQDYAACGGAIGALNSALSLIFVTDVWVSGLRAEQQTEAPLHYHVQGKDSELRTTDASYVAERITSLNAGDTIETCREGACLLTGNWLAVPKTS